MPKTPRKAPARGGKRKADEARRASSILDALEQAYPEAACALLHQDAYQLVMATILSAQCTDERVNQVTPDLFRRYPDPAALAAARTEDLEALIRSTGFFRAKAKSLIGCARGLMEHHGGEVPRQLDALVRLPGIGRKTASVVLGHAFGLAEGIAVDTHVHRLANRLALVRSDDAGAIEKRLMELLPRERWIRTTDLLIFHGRRVCQARRPACGRCPVFALCRWEDRQAHAHAQ